jgi:hypothetical protein
VAAVLIAALAVTWAGHPSRDAQVGTSGPQEGPSADANQSGGVWWVPPELRQALIQDSMSEAECMRAQGIADWPALPAGFGDGSTTSPTVGPGDTGSDQAISAIAGPCKSVFEQGRLNWLRATQLGAQHLGA